MWGAVDSCSVLAEPLRSIGRYRLGLRHHKPQLKPIEPAYLVLNGIIAVHFRAGNRW